MRCAKISLFCALLLAACNGFVQNSPSQCFHLKRSFESIQDNDRLQTKMSLKDKMGSTINRRSLLVDIGLGVAFTFLPAEPLRGSIIAGAAPGSVFPGEYSDPNHPGMQRKITIAGSKILIQGTDDGKNFWKLLAEPKGDTVLIDFSPKGGPKDLLGKWDGSGIRFPDGNKWTKVTPKTFVGDYSDPNHPGMPRAISLAGNDAVVEGSDDGKVFWTLSGKIEGTTILIDFSPKGGPKDLLGQWDGTGIVFPDGNKWTLITKKTFVGQYSDPKHPGMPRSISVGDDGDVVVAGSDDGEKFWKLAATVKGPNILVDFSPKGGPRNLLGRWDGSGISWPDGNKWTIKP